MASIGQQDPATLPLDASDLLLVQQAGTTKQVAIADAMADISCALRSTSSPSIPHATETTVNFDVIEFDTAGMANLGSNRIEITKPGKYLVGAQMQWAVNSTGYRYAVIFTGAGARAAEDRRNAIESSEAMLVSAPLRLNAGDYLRLAVYQSSGSPLALRSATRLWAWRIAP